MAIAALEDGLRQVHMYSTGYLDRIAYHDYEGPSLDTDERERLLANLGENQAMILRNHGLMSVGRTIPEAFIRLYRLERACQVQLDASAAGRVREIPHDVALSSRQGTDEFLELADDVGRLEFNALARKTRQARPILSRVNHRGSELFCRPLKGKGTTYRAARNAVFVHATDVIAPGNEISRAKVTNSH